MWQRILRLLSTGLSAYSFYSSPLRFLVSLLLVIVIPYLAYIFWGSIIIIGLAILGLYFIYKAIRSSMKGNSASYY